MKSNLTCRMAVLLTSKPFEKPFEFVDKKTQKTVHRTNNVIRAILLPAHADADPSTLREIEFNIMPLRTNDVKKAVNDVNEIYWTNHAKFQEGKAYAVIETYMGGRVGNQGVVTLFSPSINDIEIVTPTEEEAPILEAALRYKERV